MASGTDALQFKLAQRLAMRVHSQLMDIRRAALILVAGMFSVSCSEKSAPERLKDSTASATPRESESKREEGEKESEPEGDQIAEHCVAFVRATKVMQAPKADCPSCPVQGTDVLRFQQMKTERVSCSGDTCTVLVTIVATFIPGAGERIAGGLTAWISPEQRSEYLSGRTPAGEQTFRVQITYKRRAEGWRAVEFDRAPEG